MVKTLIQFSIPAGDGCLQYFTGVSGNVFSYNYNDASGLMLSNTDYTICVRMERNFCGIQYTACPDTGTPDNSRGAGRQRNRNRGLEALKLLHFFQSTHLPCPLALPVDLLPKAVKSAQLVPPTGLLFLVLQIGKTPSKTVI